MKDISVSRVAWSPDGNYVGMFSRTLLSIWICAICILHLRLVGAGAAFTKHLIHIYTYSGSSDLRQHLEVMESFAACFCVI